MLTRQERRFYIRHNPGYELRTRGKHRFWTVQVAPLRAEPGAINHGLLDVVPPPRAVLCAVLMRSVDAATGAHQPVGGGALVTAVHAYIGGIAGKHVTGREANRGINDERDGDRILSLSLGGVHEACVA